eukprot:2815678-Pyramimonas_sp.AAC.1
MPQTVIALGGSCLCGEELALPVARVLVAARPPTASPDRVHMASRPTGSVFGGALFPSGCSGCYGLAPPGLSAPLVLRAALPPR